MADSKILITASLQIPQSTSSIANDLKQVSEQLNSRKALQIVCNIDVAKTQNRIQSQLNTIANNLRLNIGNISFGNTGQIQAQFNNIATTADNATKSINSVKSSLANLADKFTSPIKPVFNVEGIIDAEKTIQKVQNEFAELGKISVTGKYGDLFANDGLEQLKIKITAATVYCKMRVYQNIFRKQRLKQLNFKLSWIVLKQAIVTQICQKQLRMNLILRLLQINIEKFKLQLKLLAILTLQHLQLCRQMLTRK